MPGREAFAFVAAIDWTRVILAAFTFAGVCVNIGGWVYVAIKIRTPSGTSIGKQVEGTHFAAIGANHRVDALAARLGSPEPVRLEDEVA